jgi:Protein of unknown function (DUF3014)
MKKTLLKTIAVLILIGAGIAAYLYFQKEQPSTPEPKLVETPEVVPPIVLPEAPETRLILDAPSEEIELPQLEASDDFMTNALANLLNNKALMSIFINDQLIHNTVVTIDNLPRKQVSMKIMPIKKAPGKFITMESEEGTVISPKNHARYKPYVQFAEAVDPKQLVTLYVQLYPLFQKAYEELGYPDQYFNDRLMFTLNNLLTAPEVQEPVKLVQPKHYYLYADPDLESRSIGQRILMRIGSDNEQVIKAKLKAIKQELTLHMHEQRIE